MVSASNDELEPNGDESSVISEGHSRWPAILVGLATALTVVTVFSVWGRQQLLDTDEWVDLSGNLLADEEVQESLAVYLVDVLYEEVDPAAQMEATLPEDLQGIAGLLAGALRGPFTDGVEDLLASDVVQSSWREANRVAHQTLVAIVRDETPEGISTAGGEVAIELRPLVVRLGERLGISADRLDGIPEDAGRVVVVESEELDLVQQVIRVLDVLSWFLLVLIVALYALAVYLARDRWPTVLRNVGWSLLAVGVVVLFARTIAVRRLVAAIVEDEASRPTALRVFDIATAMLREIGWSLTVYGVLIVLFTSLLGSARWAVATRRALAPALNASTGAIVAGTVVVLLLLVWWSPGRAFEGWLTGLLLVALMIGAIATLRNRSRQEFPDVTFGDVAGALARDG